MVNMLARDSMETKSGSRECALYRSIKLANAHGQGGQQTCIVVESEVLSQVLFSIAMGEEIDKKV